MKAYEALFRLMACLPHGFRQTLGRVIATLLWCFARSRRRVALKNLELCFPEWSVQKRQKTARALFTAFSVSVLDRGVLWFGHPQKVKELVTIKSGLELLPTEEGKGFILLCPHFIGMDAAWSRLSMERQFAAMYMPARSEAMEALMRKGRGRFNQPLGVGKHEGMRKLLRYVKSGAPLFYLPDMDFGERDSLFVPFFGVPAATLVTLSKLATGYKLPVYTVLSHWSAQTGAYELTILPAWEGFPTGNEYDDTRYMNAQLEQWVMLNPSQYYWVHKRFKTRPHGELSLYE